MRTLLTLVLITAPAMAAAAPQLKCEFDGNKSKVTIVNTEAKDQHCNYACHFTLDGGSASITGATGVKAGETKVVDEDTHRYQVTRLRDSKLTCE